MWILNTLTVGSKTYSMDDVVRLYPPSHYGLDAGFYGGRVTWVSPVKDSEMLLLIQYKDGELNVLDTAVKSLASLPVTQIRKLARTRKLLAPGDYKTSKEEVIKLLEHA